MGSHGVIRTDTVQPRINQNLECRIIAFEMNGDAVSNHSEVLP